ncbi:uncharacterized protein B0P05DRAFT_575600 [Gilbertella persicaria]|uniref:uncharacterized protein n=1 Tax=Gilbertella persicaria TaxID=101096 RepID=UPI0022210EBA|nr:uncharacterized protein B0P05DRAFT_575600 [Gilbertella persicaria]KAI8051883.1 hypothetical protein B0P05DRAFT_575600 [Gilbertella persicaria]
MKPELEQFILTEKKPYLLTFLIEYKHELIRQFKCEKTLKKCALDCYDELWLKHNIQGNVSKYNKVDRHVWSALLKVRESPKEETSINQSTTIVQVTSRSKKTSPGVYVLDSKIKDIHQYSLNDIRNGALIAGVDIKSHFVEYRKRSLECVKNHSFTDQQLLSLSNIVILSQSTPLEFVDKPTSASVYASLTAPLFSSLPSLSTDVLNQIKSAFTAYTANNNALLFSRTLINLAETSTDPILEPILLSFVTLVSEIVPFTLHDMSEMQLQTSFIHPLIRGLTKSSSSIVSHCSNKTAFESEHSILHCRPDYRVDVYTSAGVYDGTNMFGELKPASASADDVKCDFHKCMSLGKVALKYAKSPYTMTFTSYHDRLHFYLHHSLNSDLTYALHLHSLTVPLTANTFHSFNTMLPQLYQIAQIFHSFCMPSNSASPNSDSSATVPYPIIKTLINHNKKRKISH